MRWMMAAVCSGTIAQAAVGQKAETWLTTLGNDTVAFERFTRTKSLLEGELVVTAPRTRINRYRVSFGRSGAVERYHLVSRNAVDAPSAPSVLEATVVFGDGTVVVTVVRGGKTDTTRFAAGQPVVPNAIYAWGLFGLTTEAARRARADSTVVEQYAVGGRQTNKTSVVRRGDSVAVDFFGSPMMATVDGKGRLRSVNGGRTTVKVLARPVGGLDLATLTESFAGRERAGRPTGPLSPRDTITAKVGAGEVWIDYGRPSKRGRQIFGGIIPYGEVWRTGANAATQVRFDHDIEIQGTRIPAGMYTLWTLPTTTGIKLIVNKQTGQWGTDYQAAQDLGRFDLDVERLDELVERFTIRVIPAADGGQIHFDWDHTRWVARFRVP